MKKLFAVLLVGLIVVVLPIGCNGADTVTGPPDRREGQPSPTPSAGHSRPTPNPCGGPKSQFSC